MCKLGEDKFLPVQVMERNSGSGGLTPFLTLALNRVQWLLHTSVVSLPEKNCGIH